MLAFPRMKASESSGIWAKAAWKPLDPGGPKSHTIPKMAMLSFQVIVFGSMPYQNEVFAFSMHCLQKVSNWDFEIV